MNRLRRGYELGVHVFGRPVRPFHLAVMTATGAVAVANVFFGGVVLTGDASVFVGWIATASCVLLFAAWVTRRDTLAEWGLLLAVFVWASRAMFAVIIGSGWFAVTVSLAWVIGAAGAYLLERADHVWGIDHE